MKKIVKKSDKKSAKTSSKSSSKSDANSTVVANTRLVNALKNYDGARKQAQSYLVDVATIVTQEQLTKAEVIASIVEARGCTPKTAGEQYSRMKKVLEDPEALELLRTGDADLKSVRAKTVKKQENPSAEKAKANAEKKFASSLTSIVTVAKEQGWDLAAVIGAVKAALKKNGIK